MSYYTLIPLLPLIAAVILALFGSRLEGAGHRLVIPAVAVSFLLSIAAFIDVSANGAIEVELYRLLVVGNLVVDVGFFIDQLTVLLLLLVTGVSTIVQVYASRYMIGDARHSRFFAVTALFTGAMTVLVMSSNLLVTFIFWEVMGFCSYLLIAHYADRPSAGRAATKVFLVNSVADVGLSVGVILTFLTFGTLDIPDILAQVRAGVDVPAGAATALTLCLFLGAVGKSAQMPAHVWLPFAMEAPTPVSALIHAATMVNAGPFLLVRLSPVIALSGTAMGIIAAVGAVTALFAAMVSLTQTDVKRTLAYSTISQLGFMVFLCGVGAFVAAIFHLIAHGFFKAYLFLSTGNTLSTTHRHFDEVKPSPARVGGGLFAGAFILSVVPPLVIFSGAYQNLWLSQSFSTANVALWIVGLGTSFFTAMYVFKGIDRVFREGPPGTDGGTSRVVPGFISMRHIVAVAVIAAIAIGILLVAWRWFAAFLSPAVGSAGALTIAPAIGFSPWVLAPIAVAAAGWAVAWNGRGRSGAHATAAWRKRLYVFLLNKGYFDEIYDLLIVRPSIATGKWLWRVIDQGLIDRAILLSAPATIALAGRLWRVVDKGIIDRTILSSAPATIALAGWLWRRIDQLVIDRVVVSVGSASVGAARELGKRVDTAGLERAVESVGQGVDASGRAADRYEPRTLQHHLLIVIILLVLALGFFYWIV